MSQPGCVDVQAVVLVGYFQEGAVHLFSSYRPKSLWPAAGKPFLEHVLRYLHGQGVVSALVVVNRKYPVGHINLNKILRDLGTVPLVHC